jgi:hypothetical protein
MIGLAFRGSLALTLLLFASVACAQTPNIVDDIIESARAAREIKRNGLPRILKALKTPITFEGVNDSKATFAQVLERLAETVDITFNVDEAAFRAEGLPDPLNARIALQTPLSGKKGVPFEEILRDILARLPCRSKVTFINRGDEIEITTHPAAVAEDYREINRRLRLLANEVRYLAAELKTTLMRDSFLERDP